MLYSTVNSPGTTFHFSQVPKQSILYYNKYIPMCDPVLIAAILEELGYFDDKKEKDRKAELSKPDIKCKPEKSGEEEAK